MNKEEYLAFYNALISAESAPLKEFDKRDFKVYEGCMPVEVLAKRGEDTMRFGPLKPVGLIGTGGLGRDVDRQFLERLAQLAVDGFEQHLGGADLELVALAAHVLDEDRHSLVFPDTFLTLLDKWV